MMNNNTCKVIAIDFDGTLCESKYPDIGKPNLELIEIVKDLQSYGHKLVLWTCRTNELLDNAIEFCKQYGLEFDAINSNIPDRVAQYGNDPRKIGADYYIDDKCLMPSVLELCYHLYGKKLFDDFENNT